MAGVLAVATLALGLTTAAPTPAAAAPAGCGYADASPNNGNFASTVCWFDFTEFDQTLARSAAGQPMEITLDGGLVARFTARLENLPSTVPMTLERRSTPLESRFAFGTDAYRGVPGLHALYSLGSPAGVKGAKISFQNIQVVDAQGDPVAGYSFVAADTEDNVAGESFAWQADRPLREIERLAPAGRWGCKNPSGLGTTRVTCAGTGAGGTTTAGGKSTALLVAAQSPATFSAEWVTSSRSAIAIGIQTAKLTVVKQVSGRIDPGDSFDVTVTDASGALVGRGTTGASNSGTTGGLTVAPGTAYTVGESATAGSPTNLANYEAVWQCVNSTTGTGTVLPAGPGASQTLVPAAGDDITCTVTNTAKASSILLQKSAAAPVDVNGNGITDAGDTIAYSFTVTNTGQTDVETVAIDDPKVGSVTCPTGVLTPTSSTTCTADTTYVITAADVSAGSADNAATATAHPLGSPAVVTSNTSSTSTPVVAPAPALTLVKSASPSDAAEYTAGQLITYSFVVRNTGNVPLVNVAIDDVLFSGIGALSPLTCPPGFGTLAVNAEAICTATYGLTQAEVDAGRLDNTAVATGDPVGGPGPITSSQASVSIPVDPAAAITLTKRALPTTARNPGDVITYEFDITNTGNVSLTRPTVTETAFSGAGPRPTVTCPPDAFIPGETVTCIATYTLIQADVNAGTVTNTATASAVAPSGPNPVSAPSSAVVTIPAAPSLALVKSAEVAGDGVAGDVVAYSFDVTNTGNVTLSDVAIDETVFSGSGTLGSVVCGATTLNAGDSTTCTARYELTQADVNVGTVTNTAVATGTPFGTTAEVVSLPDAAEVQTRSVAGISLQKSAGPSIVSVAGDTVTYTFVVSNTGTVDLANPTVTETAFSGSGTAPIVACPPVMLSPQQSVTCTATYVVTQTDVDAGTIANTATATATPPTGIEAPVSEPSSATVTIPPASALSVVKSASSSGDAGEFVAGQVITYSFVVTNTGNVTLTNAEVEEGEFTGTGTLAAPVCDADAASLAPGDQVVCETEYTLTQADIEAGSVTNAATATAEPPGTAPRPRSAPSEVTIPQLAAPALSLVKATETDSVAAVGQVVEYTFTVTNTGNTTITDLTIDEGTFTGVGTISAPVCPTDAGSPLLPGESTVCTASYEVQVSDLTGRALVNTATVTGSAPDGAEVESDPSTARIDDVLTLPSGEMPATGSEIPWVAAAIAVSLLLAGGVLLLVRRRRKAS